MFTQTKTDAFMLTAASLRRGWVRLPDSCSVAEFAGEGDEGPPEVSWYTAGAANHAYYT